MICKICLQCFISVFEDFYIGIMLFLFEISWKIELKIHMFLLCGVRNLPRYPSLSLEWSICYKQWAHIFTSLNQVHSSHCTSLLCCTFIQHCITKQFVLIPQKFSVYRIFIPPTFHASPTNSPLSITIVLPLLCDLVGIVLYEAFSDLLLSCSNVHVIFHTSLHSWRSSSFVT